MTDDNQLAVSFPVLEGIAMCVSCGGTFTCCQGHRASSSSCNAILRNVRIRTINPRMITPSRVGATATVRMISAATSAQARANPPPEIMSVPSVAICFSDPGRSEPNRSHEKTENDGQDPDTINHQSNAFHEICECRHSALDTPSIEQSPSARVQQ